MPLPLSLLKSNRHDCDSMAIPRSSSAAQRFNFSPGSVLQHFLSHLLRNAVLCKHRQTEFQAKLQSYMTKFKDVRPLELQRRTALK
jgi:hypothetical protein